PAVLAAGWPRPALVGAPAVDGRPVGLPRGGVRGASEPGDGDQRGSPRGPGRLRHLRRAGPVTLLPGLCGRYAQPARPGRLRPVVAFRAAGVAGPGFARPPGCPPGRHEHRSPPPTPMSQVVSTADDVVARRAREVEE